MDIPISRVLYATLLRLSSQSMARQSFIWDLLYSKPQATPWLNISHKIILTSTALRRGKDFAVSLPPKGLVSVRTSRITPDGRYPLPFCPAFTLGRGSDFPL